MSTGSAPRPARAPRSSRRRGRAPPRSAMPMNSPCSTTPGHRVQRRGQRRRVADAPEVQVEDVVPLVGDQRPVARPCGTVTWRPSTSMRRQQLRRPPRRVSGPAEAHDLDRQREGAERAPPACCRRRSPPCRSLAAATIFSCSSAAPPPLIRLSSASNSSAPSTVRSMRSHVVELAQRHARAPRPARPWRSRSRRRPRRARRRGCAPTAAARTSRRSSRCRGPSVMPSSTISSARAAAARLARSAGASDMDRGPPAEGGPAL